MREWGGLSTGANQREIRPGSGRGGGLHRREQVGSMRVNQAGKGQGREACANWRARSMPERNNMCVNRRAKGNGRGWSVRETAAVVNR